MTTTYPRIVAAIRDRIESGELPAGSRVPSTRQIVAEWGVAMATASKALAELRHLGLVTAVPGVGTVVLPRSGSAVDAAPSELSRSSIARVAIKIADAEGLPAVTMRRIAAELGTAPMSLYRHVPNKEEVILFMRDEVFGDQPLPGDRPTGWRHQLELAAAALWRLYRQHPWLAETPSMTRPFATPNQLAYGEWNLEALTGLGLDIRTVFYLHLSLFNYVHGTAASLNTEIREAAETGLDPMQWIRLREVETRATIGSGAFPHAAAVFLSPELDFDLDRLFDFGLNLLLDGIEARLPGRPVSA